MYIERGEHVDNRTFKDMHMMARKSFLPILLSLLILLGKGPRARHVNPEPCYWDA